MNVWEVIATVIMVNTAIALSVLLAQKILYYLERKRKLLELSTDYYQRRLRDNIYIADQTGMEKINRLATVMVKLERLDGESYEGLSDRLKLFAKEIVATTEKHIDVADKG